MNEECKPSGLVVLIGVILYHFFLVLYKQVENELTFYTVRIKQTLQKYGGSSACTP
jgi:hypothetical protein